MPSFTTPIHEYNTCHNPAGPGGGQFCSNDVGQQFLPGMERQGAYFSAFERGQFESGEITHFGQRVTNVTAFVDLIADGISKSMGVPMAELTVYDVPPDNDLWGSDVGGYFNPRTPDNIHLNAPTQQQVEQFLYGSQRGRQLEGIAVVMHELLHAHSPAAQDLAGSLETDDDGNRGLKPAARFLEEGLAAHLALQMMRRVLPNTKIPGEAQGYPLERAFIRRIEQKAGIEFVRELWRQPTYQARLGLLKKRFPKTMVFEDEAAEVYGSFAMQLFGPTPGVFKSITSLLEQRRQMTVYSWIAKIHQASTNATLQQVRAELQTMRDQFTQAEQFMLSEQFALRAADLDPVKRR